MHLPNTSPEFDELIEKFIDVYGTYGPDDLEEVRAVFEEAREAGFDEYDIKQAHKIARNSFVN